MRSKIDITNAVQKITTKRPQYFPFPLMLNYFLWLTNSHRTRADEMHGQREDNLTRADREDPRSRHARRANHFSA